MRLPRVTPTFANVSYKLLDEVGSVQWPCNGDAPLGTPTMHIDHFVRGKGQFSADRIYPDRQKTGPRFPLMLTTGRILSQYNVGAQTRRTANSTWHPEDVLEIHPHDAEDRGIRDGDWVKIRSRAGETALSRQNHRAHCRRESSIRPSTIPSSQANVVTTDYSDWATNCPGVQGDGRSDLDV